MDAPRIGRTEGGWNSKFPELTERKEKMHTFCENIAKIYINLPVPNKFRRPFFFSSSLNTEYSIFIKQN
jgi:hypothetical protein